MNNSQKSIKKNISNNLYLNTNLNVVILVLIILIGVSASDLFLVNSFLTLPLILAMLVSGLLTKWSIPKLNKLRIKQIIRLEGPKNHLNKYGTPTMGGLVIIPSALLISNLITTTGDSNKQILSISILILGFMLIGAIDDISSLKQKSNTGLSAKAKLYLQGILSSFFLVYASYQNWLTSKILLFDKLSVDIGILIWPLFLFIFIAESNASNLTDGLDGLVSGCGALIFSGLGIQFMMRENLGNPALAGFSVAFAGSLLGFLLFNKKPAKIFMGDTGSLAIGAALASIGIVSNSLWSLFLMGGIFLAESISVIVQVTFFKLTKNWTGIGKRLLRMGPLHHHYELKGKNEEEIVAGFWLVTLGLVLISLLIQTKIS